MLSSGEKNVRFSEAIIYKDYVVSCQVARINSNFIELELSTPVKLQAIHLEYISNSSQKQIQKYSFVIFSNVHYSTLLRIIVSFIGPKHADHHILTSRFDLAMSVRLYQWTEQKPKTLRDYNVIFSSNEVRTVVVRIFIRTYRVR